MSENEALAPEAGPIVVTEAETAEGQVADQTAEGQGEGQSEKTDDATSEEETKRRESAKERRERDKAYKQRLRDEADKAHRTAEEADRRRQAVIEAGQRDEAPRRTDFTDPAEYAAALGVWRYVRSGAERAAGDATKAAEQARQQAEQYELAERRVAEKQWTEQVVEARMKYADFDAVALDDTVPITDQMAEIIRTSDAATDLAYHLGKNRAEAMRIAQMHPLAAARELGRIEAGLTAPKPRTESKAPPPISPGKATTTGVKSPDAMSTDEYRAWREAGGRF